MKSLISAVLILSGLSGCATFPNGGAQNQTTNNAMMFAAQQGLEMKTLGNKFMQDALSDDKACNGSMTSTPTIINKDALISNENGIVNFYAISAGQVKLTCIKEK